MFYVHVMFHCMLLSHVFLWTPEKLAVTKDQLMGIHTINIKYYKCEYMDLKCIEKSC